MDTHVAALACCGAHTDVVGARVSKDDLPGRRGWGVEVGHVGRLVHGWVVCCVGSKDGDVATIRGHDRHHLGLATKDADLASGSNILLEGALLIVALFVKVLVDSLVVLLQVSTDLGKNGLASLADGDVQVGVAKETMGDTVVETVAPSTSVVDHLVRTKTVVDAFLQIQGSKCETAEELRLEFGVLHRREDCQRRGRLGWADLLERLAGELRGISRC